MSTRLATSIAVLLALLALVACDTPRSEDTDPQSSYFTGSIEPCTPVEGATADPCESRASEDMLAPQVLGSSVNLGDEPWPMSAWLGTGNPAPWVSHFVVRGTFTPGTIRCDVDGEAYRNPPYTGRGGGAGVKSYACYSDLRVNEYILGSGPSTLTVILIQDWYVRGLPDLDLDAERASIEERFASGRGSVPAGGLGGREVMLFIGPSRNVEFEAWQAFRTWDVQRLNDQVVAIHPHRDDWRFYSSSDEWETRRPKVEMTLPAFKAAVLAAHRDRVTEFGGRVSEDPGYPMLEIDANRLRQFFNITGASDHPYGPPRQPPPVYSCDNNSAAVSEPGTNRNLVRDCSALLDAKDALRGTGSLNWATGTAVGSWDGVTVEGTPGRVTKLKLASLSLTGGTPERLVDLTGLTELKLSGNSLTGCIPQPLENIATHDLTSLNLLYCNPAVPENLMVGTPGEASVPLSWDAVTGASKYRVEWVEHRQGNSGEFTVSDESITGTSHTISGLSCGTAYLFRVSAYGNGRTHTATWGDPSPAATVAVTAECAPPVFDASRYTFEIAEDAAAGTTVGRVAATDSQGDTVSYAITEGNETGAFAIDSTTGGVTVASALDYAAAPVHLLTIEAGDQHGNAATVSAEVSVTSVCLNGTVVPNPDRNSGLVGDCIILYGIRNELAGAATLDWSADAAIADWQGVRVRGTPNLSNVTHLYLSGSQLTGRIPAQLGSLPNLEVLHLHDNQLTGPIPPALGGLSRLRQLTLEGNRLTGAIPSALGDLASLTDLQLADNRLSGAIPAELGDLGSLEYLGLSSNDLTGAVPSRLGSLSNLQYLYLEQNDLTGGIPAELGSLSNLKALFLQGNRLSGEMPVELRRLSNLRQLVLDGNLLTGEIPSELGEVASLEELFLRDNMLTREIPTELEELANLSKLYLEGNRLTGCIPWGLRDIERNDLSGLRLPYCTPPTP